MTVLGGGVYVEPGEPWEHLIAACWSDPITCATCGQPVGGNADAHTVHETGCTFDTTGCTCPTVCADCCPDCGTGYA